MADLTDRNSVVTRALVDLLVGDWDGIGVATKEDVYYGDQDRYPRFPAISVESGSQSRELNQTGLQQRIGFTMFCLVYHGPIASISRNREETDAIAEGVVTRLQTDRRL